MRSSSLSRLPKVEQLKSPKIVETEIWKKEIYKKVTEEIRDYTNTPKLSKRSGSLPNLPNYITSIDIQVVPSRTIRFPNKQNNQNRETEREILKLCGDIVTELKPSPLNIDLDIDSEEEYKSYAKINKVSIKHSHPQQKQTNSSNEAKSVKSQSPEEQEKFISVRNVQVNSEEPTKIKPIEIEVRHNVKNITKELPETVSYSSERLSESLTSKPFSPEPNIGRGFSFASRIEQENSSKKFEIDETFSTPDYDSETSSLSDVETVKSYNSGHGVEDRSSSAIIKASGSSFDVRKRDLGGGHFENLVNILQEAVKDIER